MYGLRLSFLLFSRSQNYFSFFLRSIVTSMTATMVTTSKGTSTARMISRVLSLCPPDVGHPRLDRAADIAVCISDFCAPGLICPTAFQFQATAPHLSTMITCGRRSEERRVG